MELNNKEAVELVQEIGAYERHFNQIQSNYRTIASTWLLAAFTGIGYLLTRKNDELFFPVPALIGGVCVAVCGGLLLIWMLDLKIYHRLLQSCFASGLALEESEPCLPKIRRGMEKNESSVNRGLLLFYVGALSTMAVIGIGAQFVLPYTNTSAGPLNIYQCVVLFSFAFVGSLALLLSWGMRSKSDKKETGSQGCTCVADSSSVAQQAHSIVEKCDYDSLNGEQKGLVKAAEAALKETHNPYSQVAVGAALLAYTDDRKIDTTIITGTNVENASFSLTICAERAAIARAVSEGKKYFKAIAVIANGKSIKDGELLTPCGACREVLYEFGGGAESSLEVIISSPDKSKVLLTTIDKLLPDAMKREHIKPCSQGRGT